MLKAFITDHGFPNVDQETNILSAAGAALEIRQCKTPEEVIAQCAGADALIVQWAPITRAVIENLRGCKVILRYGIGVDNVDLKAAGEHGIPVCNVPDYCIDEVADHSLALALSLARQLPQTDAVVRQGVWKITPPSPFPAFRETTFATAGFGRIARAVLDRAKPFGFKLAAYDPFVDAATFAAAGVRQLSIEEIFSEPGILSLNLPLNAETTHFINETTLRTMRKNAILINTARGGLIDTTALASALSDGVIGGAGIDVFETEPLPSDHPLRRAPNTVLTSHTAWYSGGSIPELQKKVAEEVVRAFRSEPLANVANRTFLK
ncbi:MAG TPA: C-terminal binding protein [Chthoniobacterales bacterium]|jgi:D-3-phosphoglycerate dehydrogenase